MNVSSLQAITFCTLWHYMLAALRLNLLKMYANPFKNIYKYIWFFKIKSWGIHIYSQLDTLIIVASLAVTSLTNLVTQHPLCLGWTQMQPIAYEFPKVLKLGKQSTKFNLACKLICILVYQDSEEETEWSILRDSSLYFLRNHQPCFDQGCLLQTIQSAVTHFTL